MPLLDFFLLQRILSENNTLPLFSLNVLMVQHFYKKSVPQEQISLSIKPKDYTIKQYNSHTFLKIRVNSACQQQAYSNVSQIIALLTSLSCSVLPHDAERLWELLFFSKYSSAQALSVCSKKITRLFLCVYIHNFYFLEEYTQKNYKREQC